MRAGKSRAVTFLPVWIFVAPMPGRWEDRCLGRVTASPELDRLVRCRGATRPIAALPRGTSKKAPAP